MIKMVNGEIVECTPEEEAAILAQWAATEDARAAEFARTTVREAVISEAELDQFIDRLRSATPDQIRTWVTTNVTDLASVRTAIARLAIAVAYVLNGGSAK